MNNAETVLHKLFMRYRKYLSRRAKLKINELHFFIYGRKMPWSLLKFEVHLTDKCNLNCAGCMHFSSLCDRLNLLDINIYENDCKRISKLTNGRISNIMLLGGEPLLHPGINDFMTITRKYFHELNISAQTGIIELVTNGILLHEQPDDFWKICKNNSIRIVISDYPVKIKTEIIKEKALKFNVELKMYADKISLGEPGSANQWAKIPIDENEGQNNKRSFGKCFLAGNCYQLVDGKIYKCARIAYINYFNNAFDKQLNVDENDYVDINKTENINEILYKLTEPASFCRYCKVDNITWDNKWKVSERKIDEYK